MVSEVEEEEEKDHLSGLEGSHPRLGSVPDLVSFCCVDGVVETPLEVEEVDQVVGVERVLRLRRLPVMHRPALLSRSQLFRRVDPVWRP